ncbi:hypothetical protein [Kushneria aurantia]|uniref:Uncharacterized protein n=1 Tax=Kushneria aurantia TaxID=504092 RepID=A0ABV6G2V1_9GAMM|nr:hypothetical protein [Kushneria aurantia]
MTVAIIWIVIFVVITALAWKTWQGSFGNMVKRAVPTMLQGDGGEVDRAIWSLVAGVLFATLMVKPASMVLTLILIGLIALLVRWVIRFAMKKVH